MTNHQTYWDRIHSEATHESDRELWLNAHHRATAFTLAPGVMLTREQREWAHEQIADEEERDNRDRWSE